MPDAALFRTSLTHLNIPTVWNEDLERLNPHSKHVFSEKYSCIFRRL
ncbi:hypothetical protein EVA_04103 [gut metagenome]|uniref:Uncharacterized protein n=1 Tax=gut metagenome TaxID=749906 RepID=J9GKD2_9ZZZZ